MEERQAGGRKPMKARSVLLIGVLLIAMTISSFVISHFFRLWGSWKLSMFVTMLGYSLAVMSFVVLIFGFALRAGE